MRYSKFILVLILFSCNSGEAIIAPNNEGQGEQESMVDLIIHHDSLVLNPNEGLVYFRDEVFSGSSESFHPNGQTRAKTAFLNGKKHGSLSKWFENGIKSFESNYITGRLDGKTTSWWRNGNVRSVSNFENGIAHGIQEQWYFSGAKFKRIQLNQGKEEGLQQSWRENGKLYNNYEAKNGRIFGLKRSQLCYELEDEEIQISTE